MPRVFDKNMFIMLLSVMIGVIVITYFAADIMRRAQIEEIEERHIEEIETIEKKNINFTSNFLDSLTSLNLAKKYRMNGDVNYQISYAFYKNVFSVTNETRFDTYKTYITSNCSSAMYNFLNSRLNFNDSIGNFNESKSYTQYDVYLKLGDLYINYSKSGARLTMLRYNISKYLLYLSENLTFINGTVGFLGNYSALMDLLNNNLQDYLLEEDIFSDLEELIELYELYDPER